MNDDLLIISYNKLKEKIINIILSNKSYVAILSNIFDNVDHNDLPIILKIFNELPDNNYRFLHMNTNVIIECLTWFYFSHSEISKIAKFIYDNIRDFLIENKNHLKIDNKTLIKFLITCNIFEIDYIISEYPVDANINYLLCYEIELINRFGDNQRFEYLLQRNINIEVEIWKYIISFPDIIMLLIKYNYNFNNIELDDKETERYILYQKLSDNGVDTKLYFTKIGVTILDFYCKELDLELDKIDVTITLKNIKYENNPEFEINNVYDLITHNLIKSDNSLNYDLIYFILKNTFDDISLGIMRFTPHWEYLSILYFMYYTIIIHNQLHLITYLNNFFNKYLILKGRWQLLSLILHNFYYLKYSNKREETDDKAIFESIILNRDYFDSITINDILIFSLHIDYYEGFLKILELPEINLESFICYSVFHYPKLYRINYQKNKYIQGVLEKGVNIDYRIWYHFLNYPNALCLFLEYGYNWIPPPNEYLSREDMEIYNKYIEIEKMGIDINKLIAICNSRD